MTYQSSPLSKSQVTTLNMCMEEGKEGGKKICTMYLPLSRERGTSDRYHTLCKMHMLYCLQICTLVSMYIAREKKVRCRSFLPITDHRLQYHTHYITNNLSPISCYYLLCSWRVFRSSTLIIKQNRRPHNVWNLSLHRK